MKKMPKLDLDDRSMSVFDVLNILSNDDFMKEFLHKLFDDVVKYSKKMDKEYGGRAVYPAYFHSGEHKNKTLIDYNFMINSLANYLEKIIHEDQEELRDVDIYYQVVKELSFHYYNTKSFKAIRKKRMFVAFFLEGWYGVVNMNYMTKKLKDSGVYVAANYKRLDREVHYNCVIFNNNFLKFFGLEIDKFAEEHKQYFKNEEIEQTAFGKDALGNKGKGIEWFFSYNLKELKKTREKL